jgi:hypothetical protein
LTPCRIAGNLKGMTSAATPEPPQSSVILPARLGRTLRIGFRAAWDSLGFVVASSLSLFAVLCVPLTLIGAARMRGVAAVLGGIAYLLLVPPVYAGVCWLVHKVFEHDEPSYSDLWHGVRRLYIKAVALGTLQLLVTTVLAANILFYLSRGSFAFLLLAIGFGYLLLFWQMNTVYQWPLLIAGSAGLIRREDGSEPGIGATLRNGLMMTASAPAYTLALLLLLTILLIPLTVSGVGLALLAPGLAAFLTTQATRDHLVRFNVIPAPPDPDDPITDERWHVQ